MVPYSWPIATVVTVADYCNPDCPRSQALELIASAGAPQYMFAHASGKLMAGKDTDPLLPFLSRRFKQAAGSKNVLVELIVWPIEAGPTLITAQHTYLTACEDSASSA